MNLTIPKKLSTEMAESLLPDGNWVHVYEVPGDAEGLMWPRAKVLTTIKLLGAQLAGENMLSHQHGIACLGGEMQYFIQTRKEPK